MSRDSQLSEAPRRGITPSNSRGGGVFGRAVAATFLAMLGLGGSVRAEEKEAPGTAAIPFAEIGAKASADYQGDAIGIEKTPEGARLRTAFQKLAGTVTKEGLWIESTETEGGRLRVVASAIGREGDPVLHFHLPNEGKVAMGEKVVAFLRPGLVEEYRVSVDGVRQDFILPERPAGQGALRVELAVSGARAEAAAEGARLVLEGSGRVLAYNRLHVTDATGRELVAAMEVLSGNRLAVRVEDAGAVYPLRIDPTFSDADWVSLNPGIPGADNSVRATVVDEDGNLYIGGDFTFVGTVTANRVAKWDGSAWSPLGSGMDGTVTALAVSGDDLYAGGIFSSAGGVEVSNIARWNGSMWSALGLGTDGAVTALAVSGGNLYAGGLFSSAGGVAVSNIARWNGSMWFALGSGMNGQVNALAVSGDDIYAGGPFTTAGGVTANYIAKWNGSAWSALGSGMNGQVNALAVSGGDVYSGGQFTTAGGVAASRIAKWNGSAWSALGSGVSDPVYALAIMGSDLFAGGQFNTAGGVSGRRYVAKWDGNAWSGLGSGMNGLPVLALAVSGGTLYAGGFVFTAAGEVAASRIAKWDGSDWSALGSGMNKRVTALAVSGGELYAGGHFNTVGAVPANHIAKWDGSAWSALGSGMDGNVEALAVIGGDLYAGGNFTTAGGVTANRIAKWDGSSWLTLGSGMNGAVTALAVSGGELYAGGGFTTADGITANRIAKWNGSAWTTLGSGVGGTINSLLVNGGDLYVGGSFTTAGGVTANRIAKWDGSTWSALGFGVSTSAVYSLAAIGGDLYAGGSFITAGGLTVNRIAKWNGSTWSALGSGMVGSGIVHALAVSSGELYAGGNFTVMGGVTNTRGIAKWDGSAWSAVGSGMYGAVYALAADSSDHLFVGGEFTLAGATTSPFISQANLAGGTLDLSGLSLSAGVLSPVFNSDTTDYTASVSHATTGLTVTPTVAKANATVKVNGVVVASGSASEFIALANGANTITLAVTGQDGTTTKTYTVTVNYQTEPTVVSPTSTSITGTSATLGGDVTADGFTTITARGVVCSPTAMNSDPRIGGTGVTNTTSSGTTGVFTVNANGLVPGTDYTFAAYATNNAGTGYSSTGSFTTLSNNANLSNLVPSAGTLSPGFSSGTTSYSVSVSAATASLTMTPTAAQVNATVTVNGASVVSGDASAPIALGYGLNTITVAVTAQDGVTTKTYTVAVTREAPVLLPAAFGSANDVSLTSNGFRATESTVDLSLDFAPAPGTSLRVVNNTGLGFIDGVFGNLGQGQVVNLEYNGETYSFVANYFGGTGNDLVLWWSETVPVAWGDNAFGKLGTGGTATSLIPTGVSTAGALAEKTIFAVAASSGHSLALCSDGTLAAWGDNSSGQLGNDTTTGSLSPTLVDATGALAGKRVVAIAAGYLHSVALCSDGTVVAWGNNSAGQLGNNSTTGSLVPVAVNTNGVLSGKTVVAIAAGNSHNLVLCSDGTLAAWGDNSVGQLGNNSTLGSLVPVAVSTSGLLYGKTVITIASGYAHNLAVCSDGTLAAWGDNTYGQLGNGGNTDSLTPVSVSTGGVLAGKVIVNVAAGADHSLALSQDGTLAAWGWNGEGELGNNSTIDFNIPVAVIDTGAFLGKAVAAVSAGEYHSVALASDGTVAAWGFGGNGQIGNGATATRKVPTTVNLTGLPSGTRFMAAKSGMLSSHNLAIAAPPSAPPVVSSSEANPVASTSATFTGSVNPNGRATEVYFRYGPTTAYGSTTPSQFLPRGITNVAVAAPITGLSPSGTYQFQIVAVNVAGTTAGENVTFQTLESDEPWSAPSVATGNATDLTTTTATLRGIVNPNGGITNAYFEYGTEANYGSVTINLEAGDGNSPINVSTGISGLTPGTLYHFRLVSENSLGITQGSDGTFTTSYLPPTAATGGSAAVTTTKVRVSGVVRARFASTQVVFDYGEEPDELNNSVIATPGTVTGDDNTPVNAELTNLRQDRTYYYRVRAVSVGGTETGALGSFEIAVISGLNRELPTGAPEANGSLTVNLAPAGILHGWRFLGEQIWRNSGDEAVGLTIGQGHWIEFRPVPGYIHPATERIDITGGGPQNEFSGAYFQIAVPLTGGLSVSLKPVSITTDPNRAQWRLLGENDGAWRDSGATLANLPPGSYTVECKTIPGRATPHLVNFLVTGGRTSAEVITYFLPSPSAGTLASPLAFETVTEENDIQPYAYVGQILSQKGSGTGFVVKPRVVATAAHVAWDDGTLSATPGLLWRFQRHAGEYEPQPQAPRGFYLLSGYDTQRATEGTPGSFTYASRNRDVAALYFYDKGNSDLSLAGRGGYGGFLASDLAANEFLLSEANKLLVGYPVEDVPSASQGRMHATPPGNIDFDPIGVAAERVFLTGEIRSKGGASGGPICVQHSNGKYYPAAIYLGGDSQTLVRAIDSEVVDLFTRAGLSSLDDQPHTSGGITHSVQTPIQSNAGAIEVHFRPAAAAAVARWRLKPEQSYRNGGRQLGSLTPGRYFLELDRVAGFQTPSVQVVYIKKGSVNTLTYTYVPLPVSSPEIIVRGRGREILDGDPAPSALDGTDFGVVAIDPVPTLPPALPAPEPASTRTFTIFNTGTRALSVGTPAFSGDHGEDFAVTTLPATSVAPGGSTSFTVTFDPSEIGIRRATVSFVTNDANENPFNFALQGNHAADSNSNQFTDVEEAALNTLLSRFTVGQRVDLDLSFLRLQSDHVLAITGLPPGLVFNPTTNRITGTITRKLPPGTSHLIRKMNGDTEFGSRAFNFPVFLPAKLVTSPTLLRFPLTTSGRRSTAQFVRLTNRGESVLQRLSVRVGGTTPRDFQLPWRPPATLNPGASATVSVVFRPLGKRTRTARLYFNSNAAPVSVPVSGTGR